MIDLILKYSIINGIILLLILAYKKGSFKAAKFFLFIYLTYIAVLAEHLNISYLVFKTSWFAYCEFPIRFVFSPLSYLYVATYLNPGYNAGKKKLFLLFFPAILDILCFIFLSLYTQVNHLTTDQKLSIVNNQFFYLFRTGLTSVYSLYLTIKTLALIKRYLQRVKKIYADTSKLKIQWLQSISIITTIFWIACFGYFIAELFYQLPRSYYTPLFLLLSLVIIIQGYFVVLKSDMVFTYMHIRHEMKESEKEEKTVPENDKEQADHLKELFEKIEMYMDKEKAYTNNNLSLSVIGGYLQEHTSMITKAIRYGTNDSFYNYVNRFRVKNFMEELSKKENEIFTVETLSLKCGFNSKATLHKYFKELTGLTPAVAQKKLKNGETVTSLLTNEKIQSKLI